MENVSMRKILTFTFIFSVVLSICMPHILSAGILEENSWSEPVYDAHAGTKGKGMNSNSGSIKIEVVYLKNEYKRQNGILYAGKVCWKGRRWVRQVVCYSGAPVPDQNHPIWNYVKSLPIPGYDGKEIYESYRYRPFGNNR